MNPERRQALLATKLRALASTLAGWDEGADARPFPAGASFLCGSTGFLLVDESRRERDPHESATVRESPRGWLGGARIWAARQKATRIHGLLDVVDGADARRAALFSLAPTLWKVDGRSLTMVAASAPFAEAPAPPVDVLAFAGIIEAAGAEAVVEHGELRAEVLGLEVGRVRVHDELGPILEVGVGRHDRLANEMLHAGTDSEEVLRRAVEVVRERRTATAGPHPANQLQRERWLRSALCARPGLGGFAAGELRPVSATVPMTLKRPGPAMALACRPDGTVHTVVACTVSLDLDAISFAADARLTWAPDAALVVCVPEGDDSHILHELAAALAHPAEVRTVSNAWRE